MRLPTAPPVRSRTKEVSRALRHCADRLAELDVPTGTDVAGVARLLGARTGRLVHLAAVPMTSGAPSGMWLALPAIDLVVYDAGTTRSHQEHIIAHELAHLAFGHRGTEPVDDTTARLLFPTLDPRLVRDMLSRADYSDRCELEAEVMASLLLRNAHTGGDTRADDTVLGRLERSFTLVGGTVS
ncbi:hypothetical protein [Actinokineospora inagensis]|uniref:hypothetical protein n=1 Tax=Actinokineospora inagensis TaxID=103730 RepID=UPI000426E434|nr:hypothetical protein [Actinokineospora inagensis]